LPAAASIGSLRLVQLGLAAAGFAALVEFGRRELRAQYRTLEKPWVYVPLIAAVAFKMALKGAEGLEAVCCYVIAPLGGLLATVAIAQRAQRRADAGWGLPLAAAAIAFFAVGFALAVAALQTFAALGLLAGIWCEKRKEAPIPVEAGALARWRAPGAFLVLMLLGSAALIVAGPTEEGLAVVQVGAVGEANGAQAAPSAMGGAEVDSRKLARERATAQRYKQGLAILVVVAILAIVWVGLSRLQRRL
jgi:hypothetical protein